MLSFRPRSCRSTLASRLVTETVANARLLFSTRRGRTTTCNALFMTLLVAALALPQPVKAEAAAQTVSERQSGGADFGGEVASRDAREVADWASSSGDRRNLPFAIVDKRNAKVFVFDAHGKFRGAAAALLGMGVGDDTVPGIGQRRLATIAPEERTTPAGRFEAALGHDFDQDILWVDYETSLSLHRVITSHPKERRRQRLTSATPLDNRISYGCINVPAEFYDKVVIPAFTGTVGIVYILPETKPLAKVFPIAARAGRN